MEKAKIILEKKYYIKCPHCGEGSSRIDHLFNDKNKVANWGIWYCDICGKGYKGIVKGKEVYIEKVNKRKDKCLVTLKYNNLLIIIEGIFFDGKFDEESLKYYYEEHTCPVNYLRVEEVVDLKNNNIDPHGIFEFVEAVPHTDLDKLLEQFCITNE